jgi:hypothetical protein
MTSQIVILILSCVLSTLLTYFITTIVSRRGFDNIVKQYMDTHLEARHAAILSGADIVATIERRVVQHELTCDGNQRLMRIERALIWLVVKAGGDLKDLGLTS